MTTRNLKWIIGGVFVLVLLVGFYWKYRSHGKPLGEVFVGEQNVIVWNTTAQVRQRVTQVHWGDQLRNHLKERRHGESAHPRRPRGLGGRPHAP